jgi:hypothetical protein
MVCMQKRYVRRVVLVLLYRRVITLDPFGPSLELRESRDLQISRFTYLEIFFLLNYVNLEKKISRKKSRDFRGSPRKFFLRG